jgi:hypothetical protein
MSYFVTESLPRRLISKFTPSDISKEDKQDIREHSPYKDLVKLQSNNVGEKLINDICRASGIDADCDGAKTKEIGGGSRGRTYYGRSC